MSIVVHESLLTCSLVFSLMCLQLPQGVFPCAPADRIALSAFSKHLDTAVKGWPVNYSSDCCRWLGVHCSLYGSQELRVVRLDLSGRGLNGVLTSRLAGLDELRVLNLSGNSLHGAVPTELLRMESLRVLDLSQNGFTGELGGDAPPSPATNTSGIRILDVSFNSLSTLHASLFLGLTHLRNFSAESNLLTGTVVPATLSACTGMEYLNMANNSLHGNLGSFNFSRLTRLRALHLGWNRLSGRLPAGLSRCRGLRVVNFRRNSFFGSVPSSLRRLQALAFFDIGDNNITGIVHALRVLQECRALAVLILTTNFHGEAMPDADAGIRGFPSMRLLGIANCALTGAVPTWLRVSTRLSVLDMSWNRLAGPLPPWLGSFDALFRVDLSGNTLTGEIPASLTRLKSLSGNNASCVQLPLSDEYGVRIYNWHVERGQLWYNSYIPPSLDLSSNGLTGTIPPELGNLQALNLLNLSWNSLSGSIPGSFASLKYLQTMDLSNNELAGEIPSSLAMLTFLSYFDVSYNQLNGAIPDHGQFSTFPCSSFAGNHGLYGKYCDGKVDVGRPGSHGDKSSMTLIEDFLLPFWIGMVAGLLATVLAHVLLLERAWTR